MEALVNELIGRVADKWTMIILEVLTEHGELRFTQLFRQVSGISQKMLTTYAAADGARRHGDAHRSRSVVPPRVDYRLTDLRREPRRRLLRRLALGGRELARVEEARSQFDGREV